MHNQRSREYNEIDADCFETFFFLRIGVFGVAKVFIGFDQGLSFNSAKNIEQLPSVPVSKVEGYRGIRRSTFLVFRR